MNGTLQLDLEDTLREIVRGEVERALAAQHGGSGFMHVREAAEFLGLTEDSLRGLVKRQAIPCYRREGRIYFSADELSAWVRSGEATA